MQLEASVIALVLFSALLHAVWNAITKSSSDPLINIALVMTTGGVLAGAMIPFVPPIDPSAFPYLFGSMVIHFAYQVTLVSAYRHGDLSQVYPIARGMAPLGVALLAALIAREVPSLQQGIGLCIASVSIMSLGAIGARQPGAGPAVRRAILTGVLIGGYTFVDGMGVRAGGHVESYMCWMFFIHTFPILALAIYRRRATFFAFLRSEGLHATCGGLMAIVGYGAVLWAMSRGAMAPVASLRESSVLIAAVIGTRVLGEPFGRQRIVAAAGTMIGLALVQF